PSPPPSRRCGDRGRRAPAGPPPAPAGTTRPSRACRVRSPRAAPRRPRTRRAACGAARPGRGRTRSRSGARTRAPRACPSRCRRAAPAGPRGPAARCPRAGARPRAGWWTGVLGPCRAPAKANARDLLWAVSLGGVYDSRRDALTALDELAGLVADMRTAADRLEEQLEVARGQLGVAPRREPRALRQARLGIEDPGPLLDDAYRSLPG